MDKGKMTMSVEDLARQNCASILRAREERRAADRAQALAFAARDRSSSGKRVYRCKICDLVFNSSQALGGHVTHHTNPTPSGDGQEADAIIHECNECQARFSSGPALRDHQNKHINASRKRRRGDCKTQMATHHDKPALPFDLNLPPDDE